jgi:hypothetical protein
VYERIEQITSMRQRFIGFSGPSLSAAAGTTRKRRTRGRR